MAVKRATLVQALIPAAGLGSRFYPYSKLVPKELLPVANRPALDFCLEEIIAAQIKTLCLVANENKQLMLDYVQTFSNQLVISSVLQQRPRGLGDAVFIARHLFGQRSIILVLLPDNIFIGANNVTKKLVDCFLAFDCCAVIVCTAVQQNELQNYGVVKLADCKPLAHGVFLLSGLVEKPTAQAPSNLAVMGRYLFSPCIFEALDGLATGALGEVQLTDAINKLLNAGKKVLALEVADTFFDVGNLPGWLEANNFLLKPLF
jgi:UTP--glucose-1-phosphate uridylyltransferase